MGGLDGKAFKEILYMILHNGEQMSLRHHPASCGKVIFEMIKKKKKKYILVEWANLESARPTAVTLYSNF